MSVFSGADQPDLLQIPQFYQSGAGNFWVALDGEEVVGTVALLDIGNRAWSDTRLVQQTGMGDKCLLQFLCLNFLNPTRNFH